MNWIHCITKIIFRDVWHIFFKIFYIGSHIPVICTYSCFTLKHSQPNLGPFLPNENPDPFYSQITALVLTNLWFTSASFIHDNRKIPHYLQYKHLILRHHCVAIDTRHENLSNGLQVLAPLFLRLYQHHGNQLWVGLERLQTIPDLRFMVSQVLVSGE